MKTAEKDRGAVVCSWFPLKLAIITVLMVLKAVSTIHQKVLPWYGTTGILAQISSGSYSLGLPNERLI